MNFRIHFFEFSYDNSLLLFSFFTITFASALLLKLICSCEVYVNRILCPSIQKSADELPFKKELNPTLAWESPVGQLKLPHLHLAVCSEPPGFGYLNTLYQLPGINVAVENCPFVQLGSIFVSAQVKQEAG